MFPSRLQVLCGAILLLGAAAGCERARDASGEEVSEQPPRTLPQNPLPPGPLPRPAPLPAELREVLQLDAAGRIDEARALAERYLGEHPRDGRGHVMLGMTHHRTGNHQRALAEFRRGFELSPDYYPARRYLGECLLLLGELDAARHEFATLRAADPEEPQGHHGMGLVELEAGELAQAELHFRAAIARFDEMRRADPRRHRARLPELAQCHARLADIYFARDEYEAARAELYAATALEPRNISAFYTLSLVHRRLGEEEQAQVALQRYESAKAAILAGAQRGAGEDE